MARFRLRKLAFYAAKGLDRTFLYPFKRRSGNPDLLPSGEDGGVRRGKAPPLLFITGHNHEIIKCSFDTI